MRISLLMFGSLRDLSSHPAATFDLPEGSTVADLLQQCAQSMPRIRDYLGNMAVAVNYEYASPSRRLNEADEVALLPPVSGGADPSVAGSSHAAGVAERAWLTRERIDTAGLADSLKQPEDGAVLAFEGIVRNHSRGRRTLYLDYDSYEPMAQKQLISLATEALNRFEVHDVRIVHRLGRLEIGEISVLVLVASAHRAAAFEACRWLIDTLKRTVPIWKKEYFADGALWADGEPFPEEIGRST